MVTMMLETDIYQPLRDIWSTEGLLDSVKRQARNRANEVVEFVRKNGGAPLNQHTVADEYEQFLLRFPTCRVSVLRHYKWLAGELPFRYKYRLGQFLNPVLPKRLRRGTTAPF
jgi:hypothetical protein